jgi:hypothetical protein
VVEIGWLALGSMGLAAEKGREGGRERGAIERERTSRSIKSSSSCTILSSIRRMADIFLSPTLSSAPATEVHSAEI